MTPYYFDTDRLPANQRLAAFQAGAVDFKVDAIGDPDAFWVRWHLLRLGDVNAVRSTTSLIHYRRTAEMIETDGQDRVAVLCFLQGSARGSLNDKAVVCEAGAAMVWDMTETIDIRTDGPSETAIITLPRFLLREVMPVVSLSAMLPPSPALALAAEQLCGMIADAGQLEEASGPFLGRALRDLFAVAMLPSYPAYHEMSQDDGPLLRQLRDIVDENLAATITLPRLAVLTGRSLAEVQDTVEPAGGLARLVEQRRLLAAYRLLSDPAEVAPISTIAEQCGFPDLPRFSRRFRDTFQTTASDLRRRPFRNLPRWAGAYHVESNYSALMAAEGRVKPNALSGNGVM